MDSYEANASPHLSELPPIWLASNGGASVAKAEAGPKRVAMYARYSTVTQNVASIARQVEIGTVYIDIIKGVPVQVYKDEAKSGSTTAGREAFDALMAAAAARPRQFDIVLVESPDRLARDLADFALLFKQLTDLGIELHAANMGKLDLASVALAGYSAEEQRKRLLKITAWGRYRQAKLGYQPNNHGFGYDSTDVPGQLIINEKQAEIIRWMFEQAEAGHSLRGIARSLNGRIRSPRGKAWSWTTVASFLRRPIFKGILIYRRNRQWRERQDDGKLGRWRVETRPIEDWIVAAVPHLAIVDRELWDAVQQRVAKKRVAGSSIAEVRRAPQPHLLTGKCFCHACGGTLRSFTGSSGRSVLQCSNHHEGLRCDRSTFPAPAVEYAIISAIVEHISGPEWDERFLRRREAAHVRSVEAYDRRLKELKSERQEVFRRLQATFERQMTLGMSDNSIVALRQVMSAELEFLDAAIADLHRPNPMQVDRVKLGLVKGALAHFSQEIRFKAKSEAETNVLLALRELICAVVVRPSPEPFKVEIEIRGPFADLVAGPDLPPAGEAVIMTSFSRKPKKAFREKPAYIEALSAARAGLLSLSDEEWDRLAPSIPERVARRKDRTQIDRRKVVDAVIFKTATSVPLNALPSLLHCDKGIANDIVRLLRRVSLDNLVEMLGREAPGVASRITHDGVEALRTALWTQLGNKAPMGKDLDHA